MRVVASPEYPSMARQQSAKRRRLNNGGAVLDDRGCQGATEAEGRITFASASRDGIAKDLSDESAKANGCFVAPPFFNRSQAGKDFRRLDVGDWSIAQRGHDKSRRPA